MNHFEKTTKVNSGPMLRWNWARCGGFLAALAWALALASSALAASKTWDGSASGFWTKAANWTPSGAAANGDTLLFPAGVARVIMTNSSGASSNFFRIVFSGSNYVMFGPTLTITNGLDNAVLNSTNTLN